MYNEVVICYDEIVIWYDEIVINFICVMKLLSGSHVCHDIVDEFMCKMKLYCLGESESVNILEACQIVTVHCAFQPNSNVLRLPIVLILSALLIRE